MAAKTPECIGCLRCTHAQLAAPGNLQVVRCAKLDSVTDLVFQCEHADPRAVRVGGDRAGRPTVIEIAWLRRYYASASMEHLSCATQRSKLYVQRLAKRLGITGGDKGAVRANFSHQQLKKGLFTRQHQSALNALYTPAQTEYLLARHASGNWPPMGHRSEKWEAMQEEIVREVAARGRARSWGAIKSWIMRQQPARHKEKGKMT